LTIASAITISRGESWAYAGSSSKTPLTITSGLIPAFCKSRNRDGDAEAKTIFGATRLTSS